MWLWKVACTPAPPPPFRGFPRVVVSREGTQTHTGVVSAARAQPCGAPVQRAQDLVLTCSLPPDKAPACTLCSSHTLLELWASGLCIPK